MAIIKRIGFGQVEPNHLSAQRTGQIYAQLPAADSIDILENGQFVKYDYASGVVNFSGAGEWMMVFNEIKLYEDKWRETYKDWAMTRKYIDSAVTPRDMLTASLKNKTSDNKYTEGDSTLTREGIGPFKGQITPRVIKTNPGDIYTTNALGDNNTSGKAIYTGTDDLEVGKLLIPTEASHGFLVVVATAPTDGTPVFQVVKITTMPDTQQAVKIMRVK